jgi:hypothetical protein
MNPLSLALTSVYPVWPLKRRFQSQELLARAGSGIAIESSLANIVALGPAYLGFLDFGGFGSFGGAIDFGSARGRMT